LVKVSVLKSIFERLQSVLIRLQGASRTICPNLSSMLCHCLNEVCANEYRSLLCYSLFTHMFPLKMFLAGWHWQYTSIKLISTIQFKKTLT